MNSFNLTLNAASYSGQIAFIHNKKTSPSAAFTARDKGGILLTLPRALGTVAAEIRCTLDGSDTAAFTSRGVWKTSFCDFDVYSFDFKLPPVGLYFYTVTLSTAFGIVYAYPLDGEVRFSADAHDLPHFQMSVSDFKYRESSEALGGVIYHIFVDRFCRTDNVPKKDDAVLIQDWSGGVPEYPPYRGAPFKNNTFYGGTLLGVAEKLPYISSLGVKLIYLSPIFDSPSNHKYDTSDYMRVDPMFGGDEALLQLIEKAKEYGIGIILDGVFNHTGADSIYFDKFAKHGKDIGAYQSKKSPYYTWFDFSEYPEKYTCWWGIDILPRINPDIKECREYFVGSGGVIEKYAKMGIRGMRLDVVDELSDSFVSDIKSTLEDSISGSILYGEVWEDASNKIAYGKRKRYYLGDELDGVMNYPLREGIIEYLLTRNTNKLRYALTDIIYNAPERIRNRQMNLLGTHDTERILTVLGNSHPSDKSNANLASYKMTRGAMSIAKRRLKAAYTVLATLPGIPTVFYGDEAGLEGYHDPFNRMPYPWGDEDAELLLHYRQIGKMRTNNTVYRDGEYRLLHLTSDVLAFARLKGKSAYVTVFNNSSDTVRIEFDKKATPLISTKEDLPPITAEVFKVDKSANLYFYTESTL